MESALGMAEKNFGSSPSPPGRDASFHQLKDDGGGVNALDIDREKIWL